MLVIAVGFVIGTTLVGLNMLLLLAMSKLKDDGSIRLENAVAQRATVTLPIPAARSGVGKVMVPIQGRLKEYHAVVTVSEVVGSRLVVTAAAP